MLEGLELVSATALRTTASERFEDPTLPYGPASDTGDLEEPALMAEAMALAGTSDTRKVVRRALEEFVQRQRFLRWVAAHEEPDDAAS